MTAMMVLLGLLMVAGLLLTPDEGEEGAGADGQGAGNDDAADAGDGAAAQEEQPDDDAGETGAPSGGQYTQADVDKAIKSRLKRAEAKAARERKELEDRLAGFEQAEADRAKAEMGEVERATAEAAEAKAAAEQARSALAQAQRDALRANLIAANARELPAPYQQLVTGDDEEAIAASIAQAQEQHRADRAEQLKQLAAMTPEQVEQAFGDEGKALAERLKGKAPSVGAPSNAPGQPEISTDTPSIKDMNPEQLKKALAAKGVRVRL